MKEIVQIIMIIIFYGLGSAFFIMLIIANKKHDKMVEKYWEEQILEIQKRKIKEENKKRVLKKESGDK